MDPTHCVKLANSWFNSVPRNFWWCQAVSHFGGRIFRRLHLKTRCVTAARLGRPIPSNAAQDMALLSRAMKDPMVGQLYPKKCSGHTERSSSWRHLNVSSSTAEWSLRCSSLKLCNCDKVVFSIFQGTEPYLLCTAYLENLTLEFFGRWESPSSLRITIWLPKRSFTIWILSDYFQVWG